MALIHSRMRNLTMTKRWIFVLISLMGLLLFSSCAVTPIAAPSAEMSAETPALIPFKLGTLPYMSNVILAIAHDEGYFEEQGLAVEMVQLRTFPELIPLLLTGELDAATPATGAGFFNAVAAGGDIRMALPLTLFKEQACTAIGYMARKSDVEAGTYAEVLSWPRANLGITVGGLPGISGFVTSRVLGQEDLTLNDMQIDEIDAPAQEEALRNGQVDILYVVEPWLTRMRAAGDIDVLRPADPIAPGLAVSFIAFGAKPLHTPEVGERFATAYLKAVRQYLEGATERNVEIAAAYTGLDAELVQNICWTASSPSGRFEVPVLQEYQQWLFEQGLTDRLLEPEEYLDSSFAEAANKTLGDAGQ